MEVCNLLNAASSNNELSLEEVQKTVSSLSRIWDMMVTIIREHESPLNNQDKDKDKIDSEGSPDKIIAENASNVCNTSTIKSKKLSDTTNTGEKHVNTVNFVAKNYVKKVVTTSSNADGEKSKCIPSLKRKSSTDNVTSKKRRFAEIVAQKIVNNYVSNLDENGGGSFGVEIDCKVSEEVDLTDESQAMTSDNLNETKNKSRDIIEISDDEDDSKKPSKKGTTVKVCDAKNKKTNCDINDDTLDRFSILNDITIKLAGSMSKNVSISTKQSISSLASSKSPLSISMLKKSTSPVTSKPVQSGTSNLSVQEPMVPLSHVTAPLNLSIPKDTEVLVASRSSAPSLISQKSHTGTSKPSPQRSKFSPQRPPTSLLTPGTIIPCESDSKNLLVSSTRSKIPAFSKPSPIPVDKPPVPTVNLSALPKMVPIPSQLLTSPLARGDSPVTTQPGTAFTAAPSHFNPPQNLPLFGPELSVTSTSSLQKSSSQSHTASFRRERTKLNSPAEGSIHPYQPPKTWHTPVTLTSETTNHTTSNTFVHGSSPAASSSEAHSFKPTAQRSIASANYVTLSNPKLSITSKCRIKKPGIPPKSVQAISPALTITTNSFDSVTAFGERSTPPSPLKKTQVTRPAHPHYHHHTHPPPSFQRSRKPRSNLPARPTVPTHPVVQQARPNILPCATPDVSMRGIPSLYDPNFATNQAIHEIVTEYCYNSLVMSLPCLNNETIRGLGLETFKKGP